MTGFQIFDCFSIENVSGEFCIDISEILDSLENLEKLSYVKRSRPSPRMSLAESPQKFRNHRRLHHSLESELEKVDSVETGGKAQEKFYAFQFFRSKLAYMQLCSILRMHLQKFSVHAEFLVNN